MLGGSGVPKRHSEIGNKLKRHFPRRLMLRNNYRTDDGVQPMQTQEKLSVVLKQAHTNEQAATVFFR